MYKVNNRGKSAVDNNFRQSLNSTKQLSETLNIDVSEKDSKDHTEQCKSNLFQS